MSMIFAGRPVLDFRPNHQRLIHGQLDDFTLKKVSVSSSTPWKPTTRVKRKFTLPFLFGSKAEWREFRDFFAARRGMEEGFWAPFWVTDYDSYEQTPTGTAIKISDINLSSVFVADEQFAFLCLHDPTTIEPLEIVNITILGNGDEQLNVAPAIAHDFDVSRSICSPMLFVRIADPELAYEFVTDGVWKCNLELVELPGEYVTGSTPTRPIYLYEFVRGDFTWRMTNWPEIVEAGSTFWFPDNITHGRQRSGIDFLSQPLDLTVGTDSENHPLRYYLARKNMEITTLEIFSVDADTLILDRTEPIYKGRISSVEWEEEGVIKAACSSILRIAEQQVPRQQVQRTCNHRLYDVNCGVDPAAFQITGTLISVTDDYVEAVEFGDESISRADVNWFAMGKVRVGTEVRMVVGADVDKLYIDEPFVNATGGDTAFAFPGCDKRPLTCQNKFDNILRTIQMPYLPSRNPQFEALTLPKPSGGKKS